MTDEEIIKYSAMYLCPTDGDSDRTGLVRFLIQERIYHGFIQGLRDDDRHYSSWFLAQMHVV